MRFEIIVNPRHSTRPITFGHIHIIRSLTSHNIFIKNMSYNLIRKVAAIRDITIYINRYYSPVAQT